MKNKRKRLIEAGVFQFSLNGLDGTRVEDITKQAGVAKGTFYTYFKSKEDMLEQVMEDNLERYTGLFDIISNKDVSFEQKVKEYLRSRFERFADDPKFFFMILGLRKKGEIMILHTLRKNLGVRGDKLIRVFFENNINDIKEEYRDQLGIICPSIMSSLFTYQDIIAEGVTVDINCEEDYEEIRKKLMEIDFEKYIKQFYNLNIREIIRED